jgi:hypothetical protein
MRRVVLLLLCLLLRPLPLAAQVLERGAISTVSVGSLCNDGACVIVQPAIAPSIVWQVSGTFTGTLTFESMSDGATWVAVEATNTATGAVVTTTTAVGSFQVDNAGFLQLRVRATAAVTGVALVVATRGWTLGANLQAQTLFFSPDNTYDIGASAALRPRDIWVGRNVRVAGLITSPQYCGNTTGCIQMTSDGVITLQDNAGTSFGRLNFGGTTASFPSLKRAGVSLQARLADDSGYTNFGAAKLYVGTGTQSVISSSADGVIALTNNAETDFTRLTFGGTTNGFPALRRSALGGNQSIDVRLADNSGGGDFGALSYYINGAIKMAAASGDGIFTITNFGGTDFSRLNFGGTTSSFPSLKRNGAQLDVNLGDGSALATLNAANLTASGKVFLSTSFFYTGAPTVSSGFGSSPAITGTMTSFRINVGTGGSATGGVLATGATAPNGWNCFVDNITALAANRANQRTAMTASSTTTVTIQNQTISTGAALAWTASDVIAMNCIAF